MEKICKQCGKPFKGGTKRMYCSRECSDNSKKAEPNVVCFICGKPFHSKPYHLKKLKLGNPCCSKECMNKYRKIYFKGEGNHQFGLKGELNSSFKGMEIPDVNHNNIDIMVYTPNHPLADKYGRVKKHILIVEENYQRYNPDFFFEKDGKFYLKKGFDVHHIDKNHDNNSVENLQVLTRSEHTAIHNKDREIIRDKKTGRIMGIKTK